MLLTVVAGVVAGSAAPAQVAVYYEGPSAQATTVGGTATADFNSLTAGASYNSVSLPSNGTITGLFTPPTGGNISPIGFDQYGGAGATGNYLAAGRGGSSTTLTLSLTDTSGLFRQRSRYLGVWISAIDNGNDLVFKRGGSLGTTVAAFSATQLNSLLPDTYKGNPNDRAQNPTEKYVYLNFYAQNASSTFDTVEFTRSAGGGLEFDNVSILQESASAPISGSFAGVADQNGFVPVPEPAGLLAVAGGLLGLARRLRRG